MRHVRTGLLLTAATLGVLAPTAPAAPPRLPSGCVATTVTECTFECLAGDDVVVYVLGTKNSEGRAYCDGVEVAHCYDIGALCSGWGTSAENSAGNCELVVGVTAVCVATGPA